MWPEQPSYNSCRNRHCPKCQSLAQVRWIEGRLEPEPFASPTPAQPCPEPASSEPEAPAAVALGSRARFEATLGSGGPDDRSRASLTNVVTIARTFVGRMSQAEYVAAEVTAEQRHEFLRGEVFAMAGGSLEHAALASALAREVGVALQGKPCRVFSADARVRIDATDMTTYPDLSVVCGELRRSPQDERAMLNPVVLFEVLSDSTEAYDRGAKASHYRHISSLREYVLVSQDEARVEVQRLNATGHWEIHEFGPGQRVTLESLSISLAVDAIYANPLSR